VPRQATVTMGPRDRILRAATDLFYEEGVHVGINRVIARADVTPTTLYRHCSSKDELVAVALERWSDGWLRWLRDRLDQRSPTGEVRMAVLWDALDEWFATSGFRGSFVANAATELCGRPDHPAQRVIAEHRMALRRILEDLARRAGAYEPPALAADLQLLLDGAVAMATVDHLPGIVSGTRGLGSSAAQRQLELAVTGL
jgi:AcrR family transcriptional regulator